MNAEQELIQQANSQLDYSFFTDKITYSSVGLKGDKQSYVTGYISVPEIDLYNDLITPAAMKSMLKQISEKTITLDYEHEAFRDDNTILPVGKIVEAKVDDRGLWVKAQLNSHSPKYKALWGSIKDGFLDSFSIAFKPLRTVEKSIGDTTVRLIDDLELLNVALTATPVNEGAKMTGHTMKSIFLKAIKDTKEEKVLVSKSLITLLTKSMEDKNMEETEKVETETVETPEAEVKEEVKEESKEAEAPVEEKAEEESKEEAKPEVEAKSATDKVVAELKALVEKQANEIKTIKESPVFKSTLSETPKKVVEKSITGTLDLIQ
ncbi:MAG: HK97 family phage prohead protease [Candidatus Heimdallarchaeaceae archaeon]